jgi:hypothetical protein
MKSLRTLIKLHKQKLDDLVKQINNLEDLKRVHEASLKKLKSEILVELKKFMGTEYAFMLDNYMKSAEDREIKLKAEIKALDKEIAVLREELSEQFAELKKFEIALQNRINAEKEIERKAEVKSLDEFNSIKYAKDKN